MVRQVRQVGYWKRWASQSVRQQQRVNKAAAVSAAAVAKGRYGYQRTNTLARTFHSDEASVCYEVRYGLFGLMSKMLEAKDVFGYVGERKKWSC
jgi:hypothetical protein